ncbi:hypothetical protein [Hallella sp.]
MRIIALSCLLVAICALIGAWIGDIVSRAIGLVEEDEDKEDAE